MITNKETKDAMVEDTKKRIEAAKRGKRNRAAGLRFEKRVRQDLEKKGWIVSKWQNNVEFYQDMQPFDSHVAPVKGKLVPAKPGPKRMMQTGFPDFIAFKQIKEIDSGSGYNINIEIDSLNEVIGIEVKSNGYLKKEEKEKCKWLLENNIFSKIIIVSKGKKRGEIVYKEMVV
jgi:hypothetical protein